ncbi:collagen alpha-1(I) chain-like [Elgaria multicarinata webbii]|uniref:collagen alpha-1(I) chain-like n=1 Tax=Elgaria multicarinata webbii TaxID=159646 RepID=UPI002FCD5E2F
MPESRSLSELTRQIAPPTKNGHAPPPTESRKSYQSVNPFRVRAGINQVAALGVFSGPGGPARGLLFPRRREREGLAARHGGGPAVAPRGTRRGRESRKPEKAAPRRRAGKGVAAHRGPDPRQRPRRSRAAEPPRPSVGRGGRSAGSFRKSGAEAGGPSGADPVGAPLAGRVARTRAEGEAAAPPEHRPGGRPAEGPLRRDRGSPNRSATTASAGPSPPRGRSHPPPAGKGSRGCGREGPLGGSRVPEPGVRLPREDPRLPFCPAGGTRGGGGSAGKREGRSPLLRRDRSPAPVSPQSAGRAWPGKRGSPGLSRRRGPEKPVARNLRTTFRRRSRAARPADDRQTAPQSDRPRGTPRRAASANLPRRRLPRTAPRLGAPPFPSVPAEGPVDRGSVYLEEARALGPFLSGRGEGRGRWRTAGAPQRGSVYRSSVGEGAAPSESAVREGPRGPAGSAFLGPGLPEPVGAPPRLPASRGARSTFSRPGRGAGRPTAGLPESESSGEPEGDDRLGFHGRRGRGVTLKGNPSDPTSEGGLAHVPVLRCPIEPRIADSGGAHEAIESNRPLGAGIHPKASLTGRLPRTDRRPGLPGRLRLPRPRPGASEAGSFRGTWRAYVALGPGGGPVDRRPVYLGEAKARGPFLYERGADGGSPLRREGRSTARASGRGRPLPSLLSGPVVSAFHGPRGGALVFSPYRLVVLGAPRFPPARRFPAVPAEGRSTRGRSTSKRLRLSGPSSPKGAKESHVFLGNSVRFAPLPPTVRPLELAEDTQRGGAPTEPPLDRCGLALPGHPTGFEA